MQFDLAATTYARVPLSAFGRREPLPDVPRPVGRPRTFTFRQRLTIALRCRELHDSRALYRSTQDRRVQPILKRIGRLRAQNAARWKIDRLSRQLDAIGRYGGVVITPPVEKKPEIDRLVAKEFGTTVRAVLTIRSDPRMITLVGLPVWEPREWQREGQRQFELRQRALALITPERFAKRDVYLFGSALMARGLGPDVIPGPGPRHRVGCEEDYYRDPQPRGELATVKDVRDRYSGVDGARYRSRASSTVLVYPSQQAAALAKLHAWEMLQEAVLAWNGNEPAKELGEVFAGGIEAKFIPAQKWRQLWPSAVAGWAGDGEPFVLVSVPKHNAGRLLYLGYHTKCETFAHALPDTIVLYPHLTWRWMRVPLWIPDGVNYVEDRTIQVIDRFFETFIKDRLNEAKGVFVKKSGEGATMI